MIKSTGNEVAAPKSGNGCLLFTITQNIQNRFCESQNIKNTDIKGYSQGTAF